MTVMEETEEPLFQIIEDKICAEQKHVEEKRPYWLSTAKYFSHDSEEPVPLSRCSYLSEHCLLKLSQLGITNLYAFQNAFIKSVIESYDGSSRESLHRPRDACLSAPTGSGKSLCFTIPIVELLMGRLKSAVRVLVVVPGRDLALQIHQLLQKFMEGTDLRAVLFSGQESFQNEQTSLFQEFGESTLLPADVVVCTPGRLVDHLNNNKLFNLSHLRMLVVDEADRVLADERQDWYHVLENALASCHRSTLLSNLATISDMGSGLHLQKILASATLLHDPSILKQFGLFLPRLFAITNSTTTSSIARPSSLTEYMAVMDPDKRLMFVVHLLLQDRFSNRVMLFANTRKTVDSLYGFLRLLPNMSVQLVHAKWPLQKRRRILDAFRDGSVQVLVSTDAMSRGMDVEEVQCVISYDLPLQMVDYVHRVGRTARAGRQGTSFQLLAKNQINYFKRSLRELERRCPREMHFQQSAMKVIKPLYNKTKVAYDASHFAKKTR